MRGTRFFRTAQVHGGAAAVPRPVCPSRLIDEPRSCATTSRAAKRNPDFRHGPTAAGGGQEAHARSRRSSGRSWPPGCCSSGLADRSWPRVIESPPARERRGFASRSGPAATRRSSAAWTFRRPKWSKRSAPVPRVQPGCVAAEARRPARSARRPVERVDASGAFATIMAACDRQVPSGSVLAGPRAGGRGGRHPWS